MAALSVSQATSIREYCREEVRRQGRGPTEVSGMFAAWMTAIQSDQGGMHVNAGMVTVWGQLIEPGLNDGGFRRVFVRVGDYLPPAPGQELEDRLARFFEILPLMEPADAYRSFEEIHPFVDGNGRVGKVVFNYLNRTLLEPAWPPNVWGISNP